MFNFTIVRRDIPVKVRIELDFGGLKDVVAPPGHGVSLVSVLLVHVVVGVIDDSDLLDLEGEGAVDPVHQGDAQSGYLVPRGSPLQVLDVTLVGEVELGEGNLEKNKG
jgi:hypothetical protein